MRLLDVTPGVLDPCRGPPERPDPRGDPSRTALSRSAVVRRLQPPIDMEPRRISAEEVKRRLDAGEAITFLDSRSDSAWQNATLQIPKSIRVPPNDVDSYLDDIPRDGLVVPYCT